MIQFSKATKRQAKLKAALDGPAGSGKTYTALVIGSRICEKLGGRLAVVDTEHGSASKYADRFDFDVLELDSFNPQNYIEAIRAAEQGGYTALNIDSLSHAWAGKDGALEMVDRAAKRNQGNKYIAWGDVTPLQNQLIDAILGSHLHVIATMRSKMEYALQEYTDRDGKAKNKPVKLGLAPIQRDGVEYEFDIIGDLDIANTMTISKSRCAELMGKVIEKPGIELADALINWLSDGAPSYDREARLRLLRELRSQEKTLGAQQTPIAPERVKEMTPDEIESLIHRTHENILDLKASQSV